MKKERVASTGNEGGDGDEREGEENWKERKCIRFNLSRIISFSDRPINRTSA